MRKYNHYIDGKWMDPTSGKYFETENPYTGEVWAKIAQGDERDAEKAVAAAKKAFDSSEWADLSPTQRGKLLVALAEIIERESQKLADRRAADRPPRETPRASTGTSSALRA